MNDIKFGHFYQWNSFSVAVCWCPYSNETLHIILNTDLYSRAHKCFQTSLNRESIIITCFSAVAVLGVLVAVVTGCTWVNQWGHTTLQGHEVKDTTADGKYPDINRVENGQEEIPYQREWFIWMRIVLFYITCITADNMRIKIVDDRIIFYLIYANIGCMKY